MTLYDHHDKELVNEWAKEDVQEIKSFEADIFEFKKRLNFWTMKGNMEMVQSLSEVVNMYESYMKELINRFRENYVKKDNGKPSFDFFRRN